MYKSQQNSSASSDELDRIRRSIRSGEGYSSIQDVSRYFSISIATVYNWMNGGVIPRAYKIGGKRRFKNSELLNAETTYERI